MSSDFHERVEEIDVAFLDEWLTCPNCDRPDTARVVKDPKDGEIMVECTDCRDSRVIVWGDTQ